MQRARGLQSAARAQYCDKTEHNANDKPANSAKVTCASSQVKAELFACNKIRPRREINLHNDPRWELSSAAGRWGAVWSAVGASLRDEGVERGSNISVDLEHRANVGLVL